MTKQQEQMEQKNPEPEQRKPELPEQMKNRRPAPRQSYQLVERRPTEARWRIKRKCNRAVNTWFSTSYNAYCWMNER